MYSDSGPVFYLIVFLQRPLGLLTLGCSRCTIDHSFYLEQLSSFSLLPQDIDQCPRSSLSDSKNNHDSRACKS
jgi:hypothetical protein